jgi:hypothetical protein
VVEGLLDDGVLDDGVLDEGVFDEGMLDGDVLDDAVLDDAVLDGDGVGSLADTSEQPATTKDSTTAPAARPRRRDTASPLVPFSESQRHAE